MATSSEDPYPWQEPAKPVSRGAFIVVEGLDRAGKSTQVKKLCDRLYAEGHNVKAIGFPGNPIYSLPICSSISYLRFCPKSKHVLTPLSSHRPNIPNRENDIQLLEKSNRNGRSCDPSSVHDE